MTVFPPRRAVDTARALPSTSAPRHHPETPGLPEPLRPLEWARRRRAERGARRLEAAGARAIGRLNHLGPSWHIVEWPRGEGLEADLLHLDHGSHLDRTGFLAIGPSGLFAVTVVDHGRTRVLIAGDVVQINGKRPPYVAEAQRDARRVSKMISAAVGLTIPVAPVLTFVGSGDISVYGLPSNCLVATHRELDRLLIAGGSRISSATAEKLARVARHPSTWSSGQRPTTDYRWYPRGRTDADKQPSHR